MGIFNASAEKATLTDLLKWVENHVDYEGNYPFVDYDDLVAEIKARIAAADYD